MAGEITITVTLETEANKVRARQLICAEDTAEFAFDVLKLTNDVEATSMLEGQVFSDEQMRALRITFNKIRERMAFHNVDPEALTY
jgi:hypothetical protein